MWRAAAAAGRVFIFSKESPKKLELGIIIMFVKVRLSFVNILVIEKFETDSMDMSEGGPTGVKRISLNKDQRSVLEAVYAIEKLPDSSLRDRLSKYLNLSTRQIQVWFQNRRQRAKAVGGSPKHSALNAPDQIMDSLLDYTDDLGDHLDRLGDIQAVLGGEGKTKKARTTSYPLQIVDIQESVDATTGDSSSCDDAANSRSPGSDGSPSPSPPAQPRSLPPLSAHLVDLQPARPCVLVRPVAASFPSLQPAKQHIYSSEGISPTSEGFKAVISNASAAEPPPDAARLTIPSSNILDAVLGFACQEMNLEAVELWPFPAPGSVTKRDPVFTRFAERLSAPAIHEVTRCRTMLGLQLCESAARTHELAWYGVSAEQREALVQRGVTLRTLVGVPCLVATGGGTTAQACGVLVLYARHTLPQTEAFGMLLHAVGSAAAAAYAMGMRQPIGGLSTGPSPNFTSTPAESPAASLSWLLLAAARTLHVDVAEHWTARQLPAELGGGVVMTAEQILVSDRARALPDLVLTTGATAEKNHPFSSHMSRASLYAGKLVWCNVTSSTGVLECLKTPMRTAIGLPLRSHMGGGATFVFYSMDRFEQTATITFFLAQLQVLAAASQVAGPQAGFKLAGFPQAGFDDSIGALSEVDLSRSDSSSEASAATLAPELPRAPVQNPFRPLVQAPHQPPLRSTLASAPPSDHAASTSAPIAPMLPSLPEIRSGAEMAWRRHEPVMSTDQVLSLIDGSSRGISRNCSMTALAALDEHEASEHEFWRT